LLLSYNTVVISGTTVSLLTYFHLTKLQLAITTSSILWGTLLGTVAVGVWRHADPGRLLKCLALLFTLSALGSALAWNWAVLVAFRVLAGFAIGVSSVIVPAYLANLSPPEWRGRIVGLFQFNIGVGVLLAYLSTFAAEAFALSASLQWRVEFGLAALPAGIFLLLVLSVSVRNRVPGGIEIPETEHENFGVAPLFRKENARFLLYAAGLAIFNQLTGVNVVLYYLNDILAAAGGGRAHANLLATLFGLFNLFLSVVGIWLVDKLGRKPLLVTGAACMTVCMFRISLLILQHRGMASLFWWLLAFSSAFGLSQGPVIWVFLGEIFPRPLRVKGLSWGSSVLWAANGAVTFLFALTPDHMTAIPFVLFGTLTALQCIVVFLFFPETKGLRHNGHRATVESL